MWQNSGCDKTQNLKIWQLNNPNMTKHINSKFDKIKKLDILQSSKTQNVTWIKNSKCDKTQKLQMWEISKIKMSQKSKNQNLTKLQNSHFDQTQKLKIWQNSKTQIWPNKKI